MLKRLSIAAVGALVAAGAMASNFRAADQVYLPIAGKVANFKTDVFISNLSTDPVTVTMKLAAGNTPTIQETFPAITLAANERREIIDFFPTALNLSSGLGQVVFNACKTGADCSTQDSNGENVNYRNISVESRIYAVDANNSTSGQLFPGMPWYSYVSNRQTANNLDKVFITGVRMTGVKGNLQTYRTNVGATNASQFNSTILTARLFDKNGVQIQASTISLGPLGQSQQALNSLFPNVAVGAASTGMWVQFEQTSVTPTADAASFGCDDGCPGFYAYGSVLDNGTDDPTTLEAQYTQSLSANALAVVFPSGKKAHRAARH
jgi:hypothetical protein